MKPFRVFSLVLLIPTVAFSQPQPMDLPVAEQSVPAASPEMDRLAKALAGDWNTVESMERSQFFPTGGSRHGFVHARLASGGYTLIYEVHSDGSAGKLDGFLTIWWDKSTKLYYFLACFNNPNSPCRMRGTAHWERDAFVNDYESKINGKDTRWRDTFIFSPTSHTLVAAIDTGGTMKTVITTTATRITQSRSSLTNGPPVPAPEAERLSMDERILVASKIYRIVSTFFPHLSQEAFDLQYREYISPILKSDDRREFDLTSMEFVAGLHDGHTWFYDTWLDKNYGQPVGFSAYPIDGKWVVVRSVIEGIKTGEKSQVLRNFWTVLAGLATSSCPILLSSHLYSPEAPRNLG